MKYKAGLLKNGNFAVFSGKKYFVNTESSSVDYVKEKALLMSLEWYAEQKEKAWRALEQQAEKTDRLSYDGIKLLQKNGKHEKEPTTLSDMMVF